MSSKTITNYTQGEWIAVGAWVEHLDDDTPDICNCAPDSMRQEGRSYDEACANARLIAAAPDLLDALQAALFDIEDANESANHTIIKKALQAIAKATGERP